MRRSGSGSRVARPYTALAGGLGIVPSGACRTARCSLHWCRRGSSRLHPVVPGSAALSRAGVEKTSDAAVGRRKASAPAPFFEVPAASVLPPGGQEKGRAPHRLSMRPGGAPLGAPPPFFQGRSFLGMLLGLAFLGVGKARVRSRIARTKALVFPLPLARGRKERCPLPRGRAAG